MKKKKIGIFILGIILIVLISCFIVQKTKQESITIRKGNLKLTLVLNQKSYELNDTIKIKAIVKNVGRETLSFGGRDGCDIGPKISVSEGIHRLFESTGKPFGCTDSLISYSIKPGHTLKDTKKFKPRGYLPNNFLYKGEKVEVSALFDDIHISKPLNIKVKKTNKKPLTNEKEIVSLIKKDKEFKKFIKEKNIDISYWVFWVQNKGTTAEIEFHSPKADEEEINKEATIFIHLNKETKEITLGEYKDIDHKIEFIHPIITYDFKEELKKFPNKTYEATVTFKDLKNDNDYQLKRKKQMSILSKYDIQKKESYDAFGFAYVKGKAKNLLRLVEEKEVKQIGKR